MRFVVVGAGMSGILSVIKLREAGFDDIVVYEKADRIGGTWRENTYPGIACDVPSHLYCYSFAPNPEWSHQFSPGPEIFEYFEHVAREYGVLPVVRFGEEIDSLEWNGGAWDITTKSGARDRAEVVIAATGVLHHPRYPDIDGIDSFAGACFHSARWDHSVPLAGARVGVIGTGSTAVQIVSALVEEVGHLCMFQRTAQWVMQAPNPEFTPEQRAEYRSDPEHLKELHEKIAEAFGIFATAVVDVTSPQLAMIEQMCAANLEHVVDPDLRERLRPDYQAACKRLVVSPDFYEKIQHPNAELVTSGIDRVEAGGVRTVDGVLHELDVLVLATGFKVDSFLRPMRVVGRDGVTLDQAWTPRPEAYLSISMPDFPNLFMLNGPNGPVGNFSLIEVAELQFGYILGLIEELRSGRGAEITPARVAMDAFEREREAATKNTVWVTGCKSWYLDDRGIPASWPFTFARFREEMAAPKLDAYELR